MLLSELTTYMCCCLQGETECVRVARVMNTLALFRESIESQKKVEFDEKNGVLRFDGIDIPRNTVISIDGK